MEMGRNDEALAAVERSLTEDGTYAEVWLLEATLLVRLHRHEEALTAYEQAQTLYPQIAYPSLAK